MPRDASATKEKLLRAGERLFAGHGVDGTRIRDIVELAGQGNDSAVSYHFGSRRGLLDAILAKHIALMDGARDAAMRELDADGGNPDLATIVRAIVAPTADRLLTPDGRDFLRIIVQLAEIAGVRGPTAPGPIRGTAVARQLEILGSQLRADLPEPIARERVATVVATLTATLAERARRIDAGRPVELNHDTFVANLVAMLVGALRAPAPDG